MKPATALFATAALALCGCKPTPTATTAVDNAIPGDDAFLVWSEIGDGKGLTLWLDRDGHELGRHEGIFIARGGTVYRLDRSEQQIAIAGCEFDDDDTGTLPPGSAHSITLELVSLDGATRIPLNDGSLDDAQMGDYDLGATLRGSVGRLLFVEEHAAGYQCGAHGEVSAGALVFDLDARKPTAPIAVDGDVAHLMTEARAALAAEAAAGGVDAWEGDPKLGESLPVWRDGKLTVSHLLWIDACYACSTGEWSSYTSAVWVDDDQVPVALASEAAAVPPAVAAAIASLPVGHGVSWGVADDAWRAAFPAAAP